MASEELPAMRCGQAKSKRIKPVVWGVVSLEKSKNMHKVLWLCDFWLLRRFKWHWPIPSESDQIRPNPTAPPELWMSELVNQ